METPKMGSDGYLETPPESSRYLPIRRPALLICLTFISGLIIGYRFEIPLWIIFGLLFAFLVLAVTAVRYDHLFGRRDTIILIIMLSTCLGVIRYEFFERIWLANDQEAQFFSRGPVVITGTVTNMPRGFTNSQGCRFPVTDVKITRNNRTYAFKSNIEMLCRFPLEATPAFEDKVRCTGFLRPIRATSLPGEVDYKAYQASRNIHSQMWIGSRENLHVFGQDKPDLVSLWKNSIYRLRLNILGILSEYVGEPWWRLGASMFLGERTVLPKKFERNMIDSGVYHITAVSGLHTTFLVSIILIALKAMGLKRRMAALCIIPVLLVFLTLVGWRIPAVRASILALGLVGGIFFKRDVDSLNMLSVAALAILVFRPLELFQPGFQLSFMVAASLLVLLPFFANRIHTRRRWIRYPLEALCCSLVAWTGLVPLLAYHFGDFTPVTSLSNLLVIPLTSLLMAVVLVLIPFGFFWHSGAALTGVILRWLLMILGALAEWFSQLEWSKWEISRPSLLMVSGFYLILFLLLARRETLRFRLKNLVVKKVHFILACVALLVWLSFFCSDDDRLTVYFLSLGSGDCTVIEAPSLGTMIIDGGAPDRKDYYRTKSQLLTTLRKLGIEEIDCMILTHADTDHIGEFQNVVEQLPVEMFVTTPKPDPISNYESLLATLKSRNIPIIYARAGNSIEGFPGLDIEILSPTLGLLSSPKTSDNESSLVIRISYGEIDFLFTGDATDRVESILIDSGVLLESEFLKVAHHGSKYSSSEAFLQLVSPDVSIIQVGKNPYRHPHEEAVERLQNNSMLVLRTDRDGSVKVVTDGDTYIVRPWIRKAVYMWQ